ncbi:MAG: hypothetical protein QNJ55_09200 [Xenococcus sp. MO_188.B8]|nr:hypothetical protein [Xenococcus sp. MO_188.B8]
MVSSGEAKITTGLPEKTIAVKDIILVEDLVDTGITTDTALRFWNENFAQLQNE